MLTAAWVFARHGQGSRARTLCEALVEDDPRDGVSAAALAERLVEDGEPARAVAVLRAADVPDALARPAALLETRALKDLGRDEEAGRRWRRYLDSQDGDRKWVSAT